MIAKTVLAALSALIFIASAHAEETGILYNNEQPSLERNVEALRNKMNQLSDKFNEVDKYIPDASPEELMREMQFAGGSVTLTEAVQINILRGRIGVAVQQANRTIHNGLNAIEHFRSRATYITDLVRNRTRARLEQEKTAAMREFDQIVKGSGNKVEFGVMPCLGVLLEQIEYLLLEILEELECCIYDIIETLEKAIEALFCELVFLLKNLDITLGGLTDCAPILGIDLIGCLTTVITGLVPTINEVIASIGRIVQDVGVLLGNLLTDLGACLEPILQSVGARLSPLVNTLIACIASVLG